MTERMRNLRDFTIKNRLNAAPFKDLRVYNYLNTLVFRIGEESCDVPLKQARLLHDRLGRWIAKREEELSTDA